MKTSSDPFFRRLFIVGILFISCYLLYAMSAVILPFLTAFILAYFFNPLVQVLEKKMPRWTAIIAVYTAIGLTVVIVLSILIPMLWEQLQKLWLQMQSADEIMPMIIDWYNNTVRANVQHYLKVELPKMSIDFNGDNEMLDYLKNSYQMADAKGIFSGVFSSSLA